MWCLHCYQQQLTGPDFHSAAVMTNAGVNSRFLKDVTSYIVHPNERGGKTYQLYYQLTDFVVAA